MNITKDIVIDLLPLFFSGECSSDTKRLVTEFLAANPDFEQQVRASSESPLPKGIPPQLRKEDEMNALARTQRMLKWRSILMGFAIFFSVAPFSFFYTHEKFSWLLMESPASAIIYGVIGIAFWAGYFLQRRKTRDF